MQHKKTAEQKMNDIKFGELTEQLARMLLIFQRLMQSA